MEVRQCPKCEAVNAAEDWDCYYCGSTLGVDSIQTRDDITEEFLQAIARYRADQDESTRLEIVQEVANGFRDEPEAARFLKWVSENDLTPGVAAYARQEIETWRIPVPRDGREEKLAELRHSKELQREMDQVNEYDLILVRKAYRSAAAITVISRVLDANARILLGTPTNEIVAYALVGAFIAFGLWYYQPWARASVLIGAGWVALLDGIGPLTQPGLSAAQWISTISLGYAIPIFIILIGMPTEAKNKVGLGFYLIFSFVPTLLLFLALVLSPKSVFWIT
jgi:hypothetical protein